MATRHIPQIALGALLFGSILALAFCDVGGGGGGSASVEGVLEYVYVDQVVDAPSRFEDREFQVHGRVVPGTIKQKKGGSGDYTFEIEHEGKRMKVHYTDMVPDTFMENGEVVLVARVSTDGSTLESSQMSAKCPSKYEEEDGRPKHAAPQS
jgi:cytochrome c-type biogenesis protein CcmE